MFRGELRQSGRERARVRIVARGCRCDRAQCSFADLAAERPRARPVDRAIDDDAVQPWAERTPAIEPVERANGGEKRFLCDVLCGGGVMHDEVRGAVGPWPVMAEERLEVGDRSPLRASDPGALIASRARHRAVTLRAGQRLRSMRGTYATRTRAGPGGRSTAN